METGADWCVKCIALKMRGLIQRCRITALMQATGVEYVLTQQHCEQLVACQQCGKWVDPAVPVHITCMMMHAFRMMMKVKKEGETSDLIAAKRSRIRGAAQNSRAEVTAKLRKEFLWMTDEQLESVLDEACEAPLEQIDVFDEKSDCQSLIDMFEQEMMADGYLLPGCELDEGFADYPKGHCRCVNCIEKFFDSNRAVEAFRYLVKKDSL